MVRIEHNSEPIPGYRLIEKIGSGGFGEVWKAEAPGGLMKAVKVIHGHLIQSNEESGGLHHAEQELKALKRIQSIRHPYLLSLERYDIIDNRLLIVMELADCNLWERFREYRIKKQPGIPRRELLQYLQEASEALDMMFVHHQLQHLDIKPQNLFLLYNHVKVADFGLVKELEGLQTFVTGGVTPVYAAPETLRGMVTPYCDQYSLAIVYQELLTGTRPFEGVNPQQLVLMHTHGTPNLSSLPPEERAVVGRALSKVPEKRFPSCEDFIEALLTLRPEAGIAVRATATPAPTRQDSQTLGQDSPSEETPFRATAHRPTDSYIDSAAPSPGRNFVTIPEITGTGSLRPAVVIGLGGSGLKVIKQFRRHLLTEHGLPATLENLRVLFVDTDPEKMDAIRHDGYYPYLLKDEVVHAKLQRATYYVKPRRNGRTIIEGWFDSQMLHRIPRVPQTLGVRALGRLAFIDHYRNFADKLEEFLLQTCHPDSIGRTDKATRLGLRTNRPIVYVVAGLGGGTGGGMFLDVAHAAKLKMTQLGFPDAEVVGLFLVPEVNRDNPEEGALANAYAGLRELHHYMLSPREYATVFDERDAVVHPDYAPFDRFHCFPYRREAAPAEMTSKSSGTSGLVDLLSKELFSPFGRQVDRLRAETPVESRGFHCAEKASLSWPRSHVHQLLSDWIATSIIGRWVDNRSVSICEKTRAWIARRWEEESLSPELMTAGLEAEAVAALGMKIDLFIDKHTQGFNTKGWFARDPEPIAVWEVLSQLRTALGNPEDRQVTVNLAAVERAIQTRAAVWVKDHPPAIGRVSTQLLDDPEFRVAGALLANEMMRESIESICQKLEDTQIEHLQRSKDAMRFLNQASTADRARAKSAPLIEAVGVFVHSRIHNLTANVLHQIYLRSLEILNEQQRDLDFCRKQMAVVLEQLQLNGKRDLPEEADLLLPYGANTLAEAVEAIQNSITPEEMIALDNAMQGKIEKQIQGANDWVKKGKPSEASLQDIVEEEARRFVHEKLLGVDFSRIYAERYPDQSMMADSLRDLFDRSLPSYRPDSADAPEICLVGMPDPLREFLLQQGDDLGLPNEGVIFSAAPDEVFVYREVAGVPLRNLAQVGPVAEEAYLEVLHSGTSPHARIDVAAWADIETVTHYARPHLPGLR